MIHKHEKRERENQSYGWKRQPGLAFKVEPGMCAWSELQIVVQTFMNTSGIVNITDMDS
jgi:hypothetical protein